MDHFEPYVSKTQHGFLSGKSCLSNLLHCFDKIDDILGNGDDVDILYLDFQKAFDTVPHHRLLHKLKIYGISGSTLAVISDFLTDRTFQVRVGDTLSDVYNVTSGVPQGSVLGPLLFLIYINDIPNGIRSFLLLFADDLKLITNANSPKATQHDLNVLQEWQEKWLLSFNTIDSKCKVLPVRMNGIENHNSYYLNGSLLPTIQSEKDIGINVDCSLKWDKHIQQNILKAKKCIGWVTRNVISRERDVMLNIYKSLVRPHLEYCVQLWNPVPKHGNWATVMELESVQRMFTRLIDGVGLMTYNERLSNLKLTTLIERRARGDLIEVFKIFRGLCKYGDNLFDFSRSGMNIVLGKDSSTVINTFQMRVAKYWNKIPDKIKLAESVDEFKSNLESFKKTNISKLGNYWELSDEIYNRINDNNRGDYVKYMNENPHIAKRRHVNIN